MIRKITAGALLLLLASGFAVAESGFAVATGQGLSCTIAGTPSDGMLEVQGLISSGVAVNGDYQLRVSSNGPAGSSTISQGDDFAVAAGQSVAVGDATLSRNATIEVTMAVSAGGRKTSCAGRFGSTS